MRLLALAISSMFAFTAFAEDKKEAPKKPTGSWTREVDNIEIRFTFGENLTAVVKSGDASLTVTYKYEIDKDGVIKATVKETKVKGDFPANPEKGTEMTFKFTVDGKKAKLSDFKSKEHEDAKQILEGEYAEKKD